MYGIQFDLRASGDSTITRTILSPSPQKAEKSEEKEGEEESLEEKIHQFQDWLSGIPGIDEATALSSAIEHIESGEYDIIVFDTAPTGHTVKLLGLPDILQVGLDKLESWSTTVWGYWETFKG